MDIITSLLSGLYDKLLEFIEWLFDLVFHSWNYQALFTWLPTDIQNAVEVFVVVLFGIAIFKLFKELIP